MKSIWDYVLVVAISSMILLIGHSVTFRTNSVKEIHDRIMPTFDEETFKHKECT